MTTNNPEDSARLAARLHDKHVAMLDAPVSGGDVGARNGTLSIMVGGPKETFEVCEPILKILGHKIVHVGPRSVWVVMPSSRTKFLLRSP